ncbi:limonene-1,2-epoxide hydrolase family protein [Rhodococcus spongiicola]|uniref:Epoxide hydrolase n=1 Tax=Rhodococcus spongiicola TaxID=2487352 RepID=A0A3S3AQR6_9NOCA|nr:limonene-1,2-epoxide hydrolase family protein [Rhodococcus spongiicola]RVW06177.1 epoxide hydrolase [Rhodococcus spongiicola]
MNSTADSNPPTESARVVEELFAALSDLDVDRALEHLAPDIVWQNTGLPTLRGQRSVFRALRFANRPGVRFDAVMHHVVGNGDTVLVDRTDTLHVGPVRSTFWVCGTFELRDGRIAVWRDRFSWGNVAVGTITATTRALWRRVRPD